MNEALYVLTYYVALPGAWVFILARLARWLARRPRLLAVAPDPGNPGRYVRLHQTRTGRVVEVTDATSGQLHRLPVDPTARDPLAAVAATYGVPRATYAAITRRT